MDSDSPSEESRVGLLCLILRLAVIELEVGDDERGFVDIFLRHLGKGLGSVMLEVSRNEVSFASLDEPDVILVVAGFECSLTEGIELADSLFEVGGENDAVNASDSLIHCDSP